MIIWGTRSNNRVMGQLQYPCSQCRKNSFHTIVRSRRWFTLFFIPVFPFSTSTISRCNLCGFRTAFDNAEADARFPSTPSAQGQPAQLQQPQQPMGQQPQSYPYSPQQPMPQSQPPYSYPAQQPPYPPYPPQQQ